MDRYSDQFQGDSNLVVQGDEQITWMNARVQPERLEPGEAQYLQNMRLDNFQASVRSGFSKTTNSIVPTSAPLIIPFIVGTSALITNVVSDGIFASCVFSDPNNDNALYIFAATADKVYTLSSSSYSVTTIAYPTNEIIENSDPSTNMFQAGGQVYILRGDIGSAYGVASIHSASASGATVTTTASNAANGLFSNMYVRIGGVTPSGYNGDFQITTSGTSTFTYTMASGQTSNASGTIALHRLKTPLVWNGNFASSFTLNSYGVITGNFDYMPTSDWGLLQQNRAILEYGRNQVIISQVENVNEYDIINGVFTFAAGTNDYVVGAAPYQDTQTIVFLRNSIWLINGVAGDVSAMTSQVVTTQIGCCSRNSIATCGCNVLFLSQLGVYMLQPGFELTLRGNSLPLSANVSTFIQQINFAAVNVPYAAYFNNRYYLAVPLNGSTRNNAMLIYNFINEGWESLDTFPMGFYCDELQVMLNASGVPTLYAISFEGGVYACEQNQMDDFAAAASPPTQYLIEGQFQTRRFNFGATGLKRFNRGTVVATMEGSSTMTGTLTTINPEDTRTLPTITNTSGTSAQITRPFLVTKRAYAAEILFENTSGRMTIVNYNLGAYLKDQKTVKTT